MADQNAVLDASYQKSKPGAPPTPPTPRSRLRLTPQGRLVLEAAEEADAPALDNRVADRLVPAFAQGSGHGLLQPGAGEVGETLPPALAWWREFAARRMSAVCGLETVDDARVAPVPPPGDAELAALVAAAPMMPGAEYLTTAVLEALWATLGEAFAEALAASGTGLQAFLRTLNPAWNLVGRVHFNLAENRNDPAHPFAFMAT